MSDACVICGDYIPEGMQDIPIRKDEENESN